MKINLSEVARKLSHYYDSETPPIKTRNRDDIYISDASKEEFTESFKENHICSCTFQQKKHSRPGVGTASVTIRIDGEKRNFTFCKDKHNKMTPQDKEAFSKFKKEFEEKADAVAETAVGIFLVAKDKK